MLRICSCLIAITVFASGAAAQTDGLKVYISADMEGVVGAVTGDQLSPSGFEYQRFRQFMGALIFQIPTKANCHW